MNEFIITYDDFNIKNSEKISSEQNDIQSSEQNNIQSSEQNDIQSEQNDLNDIQSEQNNYEEIQIDQTKDNSIEEIISSIQKLKEYRQSLISEAVTGKIDVRDWQAPKS